MAMMDQGHLIFTETDRDYVIFSYNHTPAYIGPDPTPSTLVYEVSQQVAFCKV